MAPLVADFPAGSPEGCAPGAKATITAVVTLAADTWFELHVHQMPGLVVYATSLERAQEAVIEAVAKATGQAPGELCVHIQW